MKTSVDRMEPGQLTGERSTRSRGLLLEQSWHFHFQSLSQNHQFKVHNTSKLRFNFREGCAAQFQPQDGAAGGEHFLRQSPLISKFSNLRANNVLQPFLSFCHAPKMELDSIGNRTLNCSVFGATFGISPARRSTFNSGLKCKHRFMQRLESNSPRKGKTI